MSDHADINVLREAFMDALNEMQPGMRQTRALLAYPDALVDERDEARRELEETVEGYHARLKEKSAVEAELAAAEAELACYKQAFYAANVAWDRVTELEAALRDLLPWAGCQTFVNDAVWVAARAALAAPTKEGT